MKKNRSLYLLLISLLIAGCSKNEEQENPTFIFQNPKTLVEAVTSNYVIVPCFGPNAQEIIFNGKLSRDDFWDCIYSVPTQGGDYKKIYESTEDLLYPSFSTDKKKIIFSKGLSRQIHIMNTETQEISDLPIYGSYPSLLPDGKTVLYSGVIDANIYLYDINTGQEKPITQSYFSTNTCPILMPDKISTTWIEYKNRKTFDLNNSRLDSAKTVPIRESCEPFLSITTSPSGKWILANKYNGGLSGLKVEDSTFADVKINPITEESDTQYLALYANWSPIGDKVVYVGNQINSPKSTNPFFKRKTFTGNITAADLKWEKTPDSEIFQSALTQKINFFPPKMKTFIGPSAPLTPTKTNNPPRIISSPPQTVYEGDLYLYRLRAIEIDLFDKLTYKLISGPENAEILEKSGILLWTPPDVGQYNFTVSVKDNGGETDTQIFNVDVIKKPDWTNLSLSSNQTSRAKSNFGARLTFKDPNNDGFLSAGEQGYILIDIKNLYKETLDSVKIYLLNSTKVEEIELNDYAIFPKCESEKWSSVRVPIKGLSKLRNRPIVIRGILEGNFGIQKLPATLIIDGKNPQLAQASSF